MNNRLPSIGNFRVTRKAQTAMFIAFANAMNTREQRAVCKRAGIKVSGKVSDTIAKAIRNGKLQARLDFTLAIPHGGTPSKDLGESAFQAKVRSYDTPGITVSAIAAPAAN